MIFNADNIEYNPLMIIEWNKIVKKIKNTDSKDELAILYWKLTLIHDKFYEVINNILEEKLTDHLKNWWDNFQYSLNDKFNINNFLKLNSIKEKEQYSKEILLSINEFQNMIQSIMFNNFLNYINLN
jgi:hypothetical protein